MPRVLAALTGFWPTVPRYAVPWAAPQAPAGPWLGPAALPAQDNIRPFLRERPAGPLLCLQGGKYGDPASPDNKALSARRLPYRQALVAGRAEPVGGGRGKGGDRPGQAGEGLLVLPNLKGPTQFGAGHGNPPPSRHSAGI